MPVTLFDDQRRIASGEMDDVAAAARRAVAAGRTPVILDDVTGRTVDLDLRETPDGTAAGTDPQPRRGRPRLGVTPREVTLLPRHWDWLAAQSGGASAALRRLVETAMRAAGDDPRPRREAAYRAATTLAGDLPGYEEAMRALFAGQSEAMAAQMSAWPQDVRDYVTALSAGPT